MHLRTAIGLSLLLFSVSGCDDNDDGSDGDAGEREPSCGGTSCVDNPCMDAGTVAMEWSESLDFAGSPEQVFGSAEGSCEAPFEWNGASAAPLSIDPPSGKSTVTVTVELDRQSVRLNRMDPRGGGSSAVCGAVLTVDGHASVQTDDGVFDDEADVTLRYDERTALSAFGFQVALEDLGGTLSVALGKRESGSLAYRMSGADPACAGEVQLHLTSSQGGVGMSGAGRLGSWSRSGCPLGQTPFDLQEPHDEAVAPLADAIDTAFGNASYPGEWDDGSSTELSLRVEVSDASACREDRSNGQVLVPVRATFGTSDGRIESHTVDAEIRAAAEGEHVELWIDDTQRCADTNDTLPYTLRGCDELESVQIQLGIHYDRGAISFSDSSLKAYESHRGGGAPGGAADRVRTLVLAAGD